MMEFNQQKDQQQMPKYHDIPQPDDIPVIEREDAMGGYFMMFAAMAAGLPLPLLNTIAAIIYYYLNRKKSRFVHFHSLQSLISQFPTSLMNAALVFWTIRIIYFGWSFDDMYKGYLITVILANLIYIGFSIWAAVQARRGRMYYFLFFGRVSYHYAFLIRPEAENKKPVNLPPR